MEHGVFLFLWLWFVLILLHFFLNRRIGILEQKSIQCVNRHDYLCSSREIEVVGPLPKIDHIFAIIYGNHEDVFDDAVPLANHTLLALFGAEVNSFPRRSREQMQELAKMQGISSSSLHVQCASSQDHRQNMADVHSSC